MKASSVNRWIKKWQRRFGTAMPFTINWMEDSHPRTSITRGEVRFAEVTWGHAGAQLDIYIYPEFVTDVDSEVTREKIILHELLHPVLNCGDEDTVNRVVELLWKAYEQ